MDKKQPKSPRTGNTKNYRTIIFFILVAIFGLLVFGSMGSTTKLKEVPFSQVVSRANNGEIKKLEIVCNDIKVTIKDQDKATERSTKEAGSSIYEQGLTNRDVDVSVSNPNCESSAWQSALINLLPIILLAGFLIWMLRSAQGQGNQAMSFGKSKARLYGNEKNKVTFTDIAGSDESKQDLSEIVDFLKNPKKFEGVGARIPRGVLLVGPPGTGKTMLARAVAGEAL